MSRALSHTPSTGGARRTLPRLELCATVVEKSSWLRTRLNAEASRGEPKGLPIGCHPQGSPFVREGMLCKAEPRASVCERTGRSPADQTPGLPWTLPMMDILSRATLQTRLAMHVRLPRHKLSTRPWHTTRTSSKVELATWLVPTRVPGSDATSGQACNPSRADFRLRSDSTFNANLDCPAQLDQSGSGPLSSDSSTVWVPPDSPSRRARPNAPFYPTADAIEYSLYTLPIRTAGARAGRAPRLGGAGVAPEQRPYNDWARHERHGRERIV